MPHTCAIVYHARHTVEKKNGHANEWAEIKKKHVRKESHFSMHVVTTPHIHNLPLLLNIYNNEKTHFPVYNV